MCVGNDRSLGTQGVVPRVWFSVLDVVSVLVTSLPSSDLWWGVVKKRKNPVLLFVGPITKVNIYTGIEDAVVHETSTSLVRDTNDRHTETLQVRNSESKG